ncbi:hypothetical protein JOF28_000368 [Leucobacter exalbidus]|uniref:PH domain-containing protein n=1 Tax=Leucobacter exalbidus TaxID=662960 RepID=A0A940PVU3_9MICO|nr:hypothetical protein [Leucobacter exalbidus]MBP1325136.1 hypothetical protein [Leucobacter exalbidus]
MSRTGFALLMVGIAVLILALMWLGWRARAKRDAGIALNVAPLAGALIAEFVGVQYVSTTQLGLAFERVSIAGLRYKGRAELTVLTGGVIIAINGEAPISIPASDVLGTSRANGRIGKAVESGGISVLEWRAPEGRALESGFRFDEPAQQKQFEAAISQISIQTLAGAEQAAAHTSTSSTDTTQEDA